MNPLALSLILSSALLLASGNAESEPPTELEDWVAQLPPTSTCYQKFVELAKSLGYRQGGEPCQIVIYEIPGSNKLTASTCLPVSSEFVKGGFKDKIINETKDLDILNWSQIGLILSHLLLSIYEAYVNRLRNQPPPMAVPIPVVRAHRRHSDFAIDME